MPYPGCRQWRKIREGGRNGRPADRGQPSG
jgi:hypothetical protein